MIVLTASTREENIANLLFPTAGENFTVDTWFNQPNLGVVKAYEILWSEHPKEDILVYIHDDVSIHELNWAERIRKEFREHPKVAVVGLGGATGIGVRDIYKFPYQINQLVRINYASNQTDWEIHGALETGSRRVAVVDGFCMAISGPFLKEVGGWTWIKSNFHCYDTALCLEAHRLGWEVRMVGISCTHHGGGTSTKQEYADYCLEHNTTMEEEHAAPHRWLYAEYRDILPVRVEP